MEFDVSSIEKLKNMDDRSLQALILQIASAAGADPAKAQGLLSDPSVLRTALQSLTPEGAQGLLSQVGEDKAERIAEMLKRRGI